MQLQCEFITLIIFYILTSDVRINKYNIVNTGNKLPLVVRIVMIGKRRYWSSQYICIIHTAAIANDIATYWAWHTTKGRVHADIMSLNRLWCKTSGLCLHAVSRYCNEIFTIDLQYTRCIRVYINILFYYISEGKLRVGQWVYLSAIFNAAHCGFSRVYYYTYRYMPYSTMDTG